MYHWIFWSIVFGFVWSSEDKIIVNLDINLEMDQIRISYKIIGKSEISIENSESLILSRNLLQDVLKVGENIEKRKNVVLINAQSERSNLFMNCYYQYLLKALSEKLKIILFVSGKLSTCFTDNPYNKSMNTNTIQQNEDGLFLLSVPPFYYKIMLRDLLSFYKHNWKEAVIIYDHSEVFNSFQNVYDSTDKLFHYRFWTSNTPENIEILQKLRKINMFIIDLNENEMKAFFQLANTLEVFDSLTTKIILIDRGNLFETTKELTKFFPQFLVIRPSINRITETSILPNSIDSKNVDQIILDGLLKKENVERLPTSNNSSADRKKEFIMSISKEIKPIIKSLYYYYFDLNFEGISVFRNNTNKVFYWSDKIGFKQTSNLSQITENQANNNLKNIILRVTTIISEPFVMYSEVNENGVSLTGNDRYSGMAIDILNHLSKMTGFMFKLHLVKDSRYGLFNEKTGNWTGMIGELINNDADLAVAPLIMTYKREQVIDFTNPWMIVGLTAITKTQMSDNFLLMNSFSKSVWCMVFISYIIVSFTLFLVGRLTPYEWNKSKTDEKENSFTFSKCLWYTIEFVKRNDDGLSPKALSTRLISTIWWIFIIIIIASYSANLVKVFLFESNQNELRNFEDLAHQTKVKYGTLMGGSTYAFFQSSKIKNYKKMWNFMNSDTRVFVNNLKEGIEKVLKGNYAFILESTMTEYYTKRNCKLLPLFGSINRRGYSIGLRSGNTILRDQLSEGILQLEKDEVIESLRYKWFENVNSDISCSIKRFIENSDEGNQLNLDTIGYLFYLLVILLIFSFLIACGELLHWACSNSSRNQNSTSNKICNQLNLAFGCCISTNAKNDDQLTPPNDPSNSKETPLVV